MTANPDCGYVVSKYYWIKKSENHDQKQSAASDQVLHICSGLYVQILRVNTALYYIDEKRRHWSVCVDLGLRFSPMTYICGSCYRFLHYIIIWVWTHVNKIVWAPSEDSAWSAYLSYFVDRQRSQVSSGRLRRLWSDWSESSLCTDAILYEMLYPDSYYMYICLLILQ